MSNSGRKAGAARIQSGLIMTATGISCTVRVTPDLVKIRTASYTDYILARAAIVGRVSAEIVRG